MEKLSDEEVNKIMDDFCYFICGYTEKEFRGINDVNSIKSTLERPLIYPDIDIFLRTMRGNLARFRAAPVINEYSYRDHLVKETQDLIDILYIKISMDDENQKLIGKFDDARNEFMRIILSQMLGTLITIAIKYVEPSFWNRLSGIRAGTSGIELKFPKE